MINNDIIQQGKEGEDAFQTWLNSEELGFLRIDQDWKSMSSVFKESVKRPDYLLLLPSIGFIAIDVKHSSLNSSCFTLTIDNELERTIAFEHYTRIYLWYAYKDKDYSGNSIWHFISAHKALEKGIKKRNQKKNISYFSIKLKYFERVTKSEDLSKLFNSRIGLLGKFTRAIEHSLSSIKSSDG